MRGGQLVAANQARAIEDVLKALGDADDDELGDLAEAPVEITLSERDDERNQQLKQLGQVVRTGSPKARLAAVKALGTSREVGVVPLLIYALTDPDPQVTLAADRALRVSSRRLDAEPLQLPLDDAARNAARDRWTNWYRQLYPDLALD
jgi:HEAT repeat protein